MLVARGIRTDRTNGRGSSYNAIDKLLYKWFLIRSRRGREHIPIRLTVLQDKVRTLVDKLGATNLEPSWGFVQKC